MLPGSSFSIIWKANLNKKSKIDLRALLEVVVELVGVDLCDIK